MSLTSALSIALSGLQVTTAQMQLTSNNIANAQTPGYTEKSAVLSAVTFGNNSGGVTISSYQRQSDSALQTTYNNATSAASFAGSQNNYLQQVQALLGSNSSNPPLSSALANFQSAWTQLSSEPEDATAQQTVIDAGVNLANQIQDVANGITTISSQVTSDINTTTTSLNSDLQQVTSLNAQIAAATGANQPIGNLEDQRDTLVNQISAITNVTVMQRPENEIALYTPGGLLLVDGGSAQSFTYNGTDIVSSGGQTVTSDLTGGSLQAEVGFVNGSPSSTDPGTGVIGKLQSQLQALTTALTTTTGSPATFAAAYNGATTGTGELASSFFTTDGSVDPASIAVNAALLNGTSTVKEASAAPVLTALNAGRNFTASGLSVSNSDYTTLGTAILSGFQQAANTVQTASTSASQQQTFYQQSLSNATGVNVDNELVNLTTLQNSYAASAHVISTVNAMLADLENVI